MGRPPAVVIIARHGARLDAADKQWHLTSPTPYDPPLTYGGWTQSRALGVRIAALLHAREESLRGDPRAKDLGRTASRDKHTNKKKSETALETRPNLRRTVHHNVMIHSSPFLRCVQTSIAIAAGLGQYHGLTSSSHGKSTLTQRLHGDSSPHHTHQHGHSYSLSAIQEPDDARLGSRHNHMGKGTDIPKIQLRLDAFLGEWLSPEYYESITPPPGSLMMLASAKADLLRPGDTVHIGQDSTRNGSRHGNFPGGWASTSPDTDDPLSSISNLTEALPSRDRASTQSAVEGSGSRTSGRLSQKKNKMNATQHGYIPPVPSYALSPSHPIPPGYVADARDACVEVDYQWDSMRPPQDWGNGGEYGEEWSSMHKRFRRGLQEMISWYCLHPELPSDPERDTNPSEDEDKDEDEDTIEETVLILITHGAGCNALIGALTNQPVLLDVGMASLTMAVRKEIGAVPKSSFMPALDSRRRSSVDAGVLYDYDVPLIASTDHLRSPSTPVTTMMRQGTQSSSVQNSSMYRGRFRSISSINVCESPINEAFKLPETISRKGLQRSSSASFENPIIGLWSKPVAEPDKTVDKSVRGESKITKGMENNGLKNEVDDDEAMPLQSISNRKNKPVGLWGAMPHDVVSERERGMKRRWTMSEQST